MKQSSEEMSRVAAMVLNMNPLGEDDTLLGAQYNVLLTDAKSLAGSVLSQDERPQGSTAVEARQSSDMVEALSEAERVLTAILVDYGVDRHRARAEAATNVFRVLLAKIGGGE